MSCRPNSTDKLIASFHKRRIRKWITINNVSSHASIGNEVVGGMAVTT